MQLLTVPECAARLMVSPRTVYRLIADGDLPVVMVRSRIRIAPDALDAYVKSASYPAFRRTR